MGRRGRCERGRKRREFSIIGNESQFAEKSGEVKRGGVEKRKGLVYLPIQAVRFNSYNGGFVLKSTVF